MTRKFKKAVQGVVADGKITNDEKNAIFDLAKEENLSPYEVQIYLSSELKKIQKKIEKQNYKRERSKANGSFLNNDTVKQSAAAGILYAIKKGAPHLLKVGKKALPLIIKLVTKK